MSDEEELYCRLCAETTPKTQLIFSDEDVALSSKIATKMQWINVDITTSNNLPSTICFSCFDLLERTWNFLHNVRSAQQKLQTIFTIKSSDSNRGTSPDIKPDLLNNAGKPVDKEWSVFKNPKSEVKIDPEQDLEVIGAVDSNNLIDEEMPVKTECIDTDIYNNDAQVYSTDSDQPLQPKKKQKIKKKKKIKYDAEILPEDLLKTETDAVPLDMSSLNMTWDDYTCRCAQCEASCKNIVSLRLHALHIHTNCCIFKCSDCGKVTTSFKLFINHVRTHKKVLRYCCEYCNKQFSMTAYLKKHMNTTHKNLKILSCQNCGAYFDNPDLLQDHLIIYSKGYKRSRKCDKIEPDLKCDLCSKEFKSRGNLQQHRLVHTERSRDFSCHVCGKMFFTKGSLGTHMSTHEEVKPFKCEFCPMAFRARGNLQSHISLHSGSKPFICELCGKSFRVKRHLKSHSIVHTDLMPYHCTFCNKSFRFKTRLNLHLRQHTGAKPYNCVYCQRDFTNGSNYKKHMKRRHNIDTSKKKYFNQSVNTDNGENQEDIDDLEQGNLSNQTAD